MYEKLLDGYEAKIEMESIISGMLLYTIKNQFKAVKRKAGMFQSTKADGGQHGIGLRSIKGITEKYQGNVVISAEAAIFELKVYLFL